MSAELAPLQCDPWASRFIDIERLNAHASAMVVERLDAVRAASAAGELLPTTSFAVLGAAGAGKTHLFARLRRTVGVRASFVLVRPLLGAEPTLRLLLAEIMDQLRRPSFGGSLSQLEALVGGALGATARFPSAGLADAASASRATRTARVDDVVARLLARRPELEGTADYARRLLGFPFEPPETRAVLAAWLSGRDVEPEAARAALLPGPLSDVDVLRALTTIATLAAVEAPLVVAFDQLENLADAQGHRVRAHGNLVAELVDQLPALTLVQLALTGEWLQHIQPALSLPQRTRVAERTVLLEEPTLADRESLVRAWLEASNLGTGAFPSPLLAVDVERWCREPGMTPRLLLQACRTALMAPPAVAPVAVPAAVPAPVAAPVPNTAPRARAGDPTVDAPRLPVPAAPRERPSRPRARPKPRDASRMDGTLNRAWRAAVRDARRDIREARGEDRLLDVERIADVIDVIVVHADETALVWRRGAGASPYLLGTLAAGSVRGNVVVVQGNHPRSVATALERARELTHAPVLFIRQGSFEFPPTWRDVAARVTELQQLTRTCWLAISDDVLADGLAFAAMLAAARSGELTGPAGDAVTPVVLRAWSSATLGDSIDTLEDELRRVLAGWEPPAPSLDGAPPEAPAPKRLDDASPRGARVTLGALLDRAVSAWPIGEAPLRWLRAVRDHRASRRAR